MHPRKLLLQPEQHEHTAIHSTSKVVTLDTMSPCKQAAGKQCMALHQALTDCCTKAGQLTNALQQGDLLVKVAKARHQHPVIHWYEGNDADGVEEG